jgi:hypothetical protein
MQPPRLRAGLDGQGPELGLAYVGISRVKRTDGKNGLTLLGPLQEAHFTSRPVKRRLIAAEYTRLRELPGAILVQEPLGGVDGGGVDSGGADDGDGDSA